MTLSREHMAKLSTAKNYEEAVAMAKELDIDTDDRFTAEMNTYFENLKSGQLSDSDLDGISGGEINWGNGQGDGRKQKPSDVVFAFNVGDEVETYHWGYTQRGVITERKAAYCKSNSWYYPLYKVDTFKSFWSAWYTQDDLSY